jgi:putative PIN family toxin of toxin-antitoxin system
MDASVLFAALYSPTGSARDLLRLAMEGKVSLVISQNILEEVERNILKKAPQASPLYQALLTTLDLEIVAAPTQEAVDKAAEFVAEKDAHVIAAAIEAKPDWLTTYDQKHLLIP